MKTNELKIEEHGYTVFAGRPAAGKRSMLPLLADLKGNPSEAELQEADGIEFMWKPPKSPNDQAQTPPI